MIAQQASGRFCLISLLQITWNKKKGLYAKYPGQILWLSLNTNVQITLILHGSLEQWRKVKFY